MVDTIIDGQDMDRIFQIDFGAEVHISGVTMGDGLASGGQDGGAIFNVGTLHLSHVEIVSNRAFNGAAIHGSSATLTIEDSIISDNETTGSGGGGLQVLNGSAMIERTIIEGNRTTGPNRHGGGIAVRGNATVNIVDTTIEGNSATGSGGGIRVSDTADVNVISSTISGNSSEATGGGLFIGDGSGSGGGVAVGNGTLAMMNTILAGNIDPNGDPDCRTRPRWSVSGDALSGPTLSGSDNAPWHF